MILPIHIHIVARDGNGTILRFSLLTSILLFFRFQSERRKGWDEGLQGLCKGAKAKLIIPSEFGYGEVGAGDKIPGGATLNFDVEVVDITDPPARPPTPNVFKMIDTDEDNKLSVEEIEAYFKGMDKEMPEGLMESEDKDADGFVSWEEFSGPKGDGPGGDEL